MATKGAEHGFVEFVDEVFVVGAQEWRGDEEEVFDFIAVMRDVFDSEEGAHRVSGEDGGGFEAEFFDRASDGAGVVADVVIRPVGGGGVAEAEEVDTDETGVVEFGVSFKVGEDRFP